MDAWFCIHGLLLLIMFASFNRTIANLSVIMARTTQDYDTETPLRIGLSDSMPVMSC